jgi:hypothetical protein
MVIATLRCFFSASGLASLSDKPGYTAKLICRLQVGQIVTQLP